jgi:fluoride ion exporter CrcB/FEX
MSLILCIGIILAFKTPGEPITLLNVLLGVIIGFSGGYTTFKYKSKE